MRVAYLNSKGGTGKTTSAAFTAAGLAQDGRTLLVDTDPQGSALSWSEVAEGLGFAVVGLPVRDVHKRIEDFASDYKHIVIDTPPGDRAIMRSALLAAETVVVPLAPTLLDQDRLGPTLDLLEETEMTPPGPGPNLADTGARAHQERRRCGDGAPVRLQLAGHGTSHPAH